MITTQDVSIIDSKLNGTFELPLPYSDEPSIKEIENFLQIAIAMHDFVHYDRYLSQHYGRIRCKAILDMTKEEIFSSQTEFLQGRKQSTLDMEAFLKSYKGLIK